MLIIATVVGFFIVALIMYLCGIKSAIKIIKFQWNMIDYLNEETKEIPNLIFKVSELEREISELKDAREP